MKSANSKGIHEFLAEQNLVKYTLESIVPLFP